MTEALLDVVAGKLKAAEKSLKADEEVDDVRGSDG